MEKKKSISDVFDEFVEKWKDKVPFFLGVAGLVTVVGYIIAYAMLTSYLSEIKFSVSSIESHIIFSIVINVIQFFASIFIIMMAGSFFSYRVLNKHKDIKFLIRMGWTSSLMLAILFFAYFKGAEFFQLEERGTFLYLCSLMAGLGFIEFLIIKKADNKDITMVFWQIFYSLITFLVMLSLIYSVGLDWGNLSLAILASIIIHAYPYIFIISPLKSWTLYSVISLFLLLFILLIVSPSTLQHFSFRDAQIGEIEYASVKIKDKACNELNKYYTPKPCHDNRIKDVKGLWMQGDTYLFKSEDARYMIPKTSIIERVEKKNELAKVLLKKG